MPFLEPNSAAANLAVEKAVDVVSNGAKKVGTPLSQVAEYLPPTAGAYMMHASKAGRWVTPFQVFQTNVAVFKSCMRFTNGSITLSCISTGAMCALTLIPGPQQAPSIVLCQSLVLFTNTMQGG